MPDVFGVEVSALPEGWTPMEAVGVVKCLDGEGHEVLTLFDSETLSEWEAVGMLTAALDLTRRAVNEGFEGDEDDDLF